MSDARPPIMSWNDRVQAWWSARSGMAEAHAAMKRATGGAAIAERYCMFEAAELMAAHCWKQALHARKLGRCTQRLGRSAGLPRLDEAPASPTRRGRRTGAYEDHRSGRARAAPAPMGVGWRPIKTLACPIREGKG